MPVIEKDVKSKPVAEKLGSKNRKIKPINKLRTHYIIILRLLFTKSQNTRINVNKIFRHVSSQAQETIQTGLRYKPYTLDTIRNLEIAEIIHKEREGQTDFIELTSTGKAISQLLVESESYNKSYFEMVWSMKDKILFARDWAVALLDMNPNDPSCETEAKEIIEEHRKVMSVQGWDYDEIEFYNRIRTNIIDLKTICDRNHMGILLHRYASIKENNNLNKEANKILDDLVLHTIEEKTKFILKNFEEEKLGYPMVRYNRVEKYKIEVHTRSGGAYEKFRDIFNLFHNEPMPSVLIKEIKNMVMSYLALLKPLVGNEELLLFDLKREIIDLTSKLQIEPQNEIDVMKYKYIKILLKTNQFFFDVFKEYCKMVGYECIL